MLVIDTGWEEWEKLIFLYLFKLLIFLLANYKHSCQISLLSIPCSKFPALVCGHDSHTGSTYGPLFLNGFSQTKNPEHMSPDLQVMRTLVWETLTYEPESYYFFKLTFTWKKFCLYRQRNAALQNKLLVI